MILYINFSQNPSFSSRDSERKRNFGSKFDMLKCLCDLENKGKVTKILATLCPLPAMYLCKFYQNTLTGSGDKVWKRLILQSLKAGDLEK